MFRHRFRSQLLNRATVILRIELPYARRPSPDGYYLNSNERLSLAGERLQRGRFLQYFWMACSPEFLSYFYRVNSSLLPPIQLSTALMELAMMDRTERNRKLIRNFFAQRCGLHELEMVCMSMGPSTDEARFPGNIRKMALVTYSTGFRERKSRLINWEPSLLHSCGRPLDRIDFWPRG